MLSRRTDFTFPHDTRETERKVVALLDLTFWRGIENPENGACCAELARCEEFISLHKTVIEANGIDSRWDSAESPAHRISCATVKALLIVEPFSLQWLSATWKVSRIPFVSGFEIVYSHTWSDGSCWVCLKQSLSSCNCDCSTLHPPSAVIYVPWFNKRNSNSPNIHHEVARTATKERRKLRFIWLLVSCGIPFFLCHRTLGVFASSEMEMLGDEHFHCYISWR